MKTVQEVLRELDLERLLDTYVYDHPIPNYELQAMNIPASEIFKRYKDLYRQFVERLRGMEIQPAEDGHQGILFVSRYLKDYMDENVYELIYEDDLLENGVQCTSYAYEFTPQAEILGFLVADNPFTQANLYDLMSDVLHEASFFGFQQDALDEELERLKEAEAQAKAGEGITLEQLEQDLHKELGWKPRWHHKEDPEEAGLKRQAFEACRAYQAYCCEKELVLIKTQLEGKRHMTLSEIKQETETVAIKELEAAAERPPVFDDDSPEMTEEQLAQFRRSTAQSHLQDDHGV